MLSPAGLRGRAGHIAAGSQCDRRAAAGNRTRAWPTGGGIRKCFWEGRTLGELRGLRGDVGGGGGGSRGGSSLPTGAWGGRSRLRPRLLGLYLVPAGNLQRSVSDKR